MQNLIQRIKRIELFLPISTPLILWNLFTLIFILLDFILTVLVNCFRDRLSNILLYDFFNIVLPFILLADLLIQFNTGYIKNGKIILNRKSANLQYIYSFYFSTDIISFIMSILQLIFTHTFQPQITLLSYVIFIKLFKAKLFDSTMKKYVIKSNKILLYYQTVKNFVLLTILCHTVGSFYFFLDVVLYQKYNYPPSKLWIFSSYAMNDIYSQSFTIQYIYTFYFSIVTLSGTCYGDIVPLNPIQNCYILVCFILPLLIYSYVFQSIFSAIVNGRSSIVKIRKYKLLAKEYLKSLGVNYKIMNKIVTYLEFTYKKDMVVNTQFIEDLAPDVKKQYLEATIKGKFKYDCFNEILKIVNFHSDHLEEILFEHIKQEYYPQRSTLLTPEKLKLYYINTGKVVQVVKLNQKKKLSKNLKNQSHIAKINFFTNQIPYQKITYQTNSFVICHSLDYISFKTILKQKLHLLKQSFCYLQNQIIDQGNYKIFDEKCYFCDQIQHMLQNCPYITPQRAQVFLNKQLKFQDRILCNRNLLKKGNIQISTNKSKKIYEFNSEKNKKNIIEVFTNFNQSSKAFNVKDKNYSQQINQQELDKIAFRQEMNNLNINKIKNKKIIERSFQKVAIYDTFYPQWNILN